MTEELLELAANAIGTNFVPGESWDEGAGWNPLEDDGDALRQILDSLQFLRTSRFAAERFLNRFGELYRLGGFKHHHR